MMNQGYQPDPIGNRRPQGQRSENEVLARVQDVSSKVEDAIERYTQVGPLIHLLGGELMVAYSSLYPCYG